MYILHSIHIHKSMEVYNKRTCKDFMCLTEGTVNETLPRINIWALANKYKNLDQDNIA